MINIKKYMLISLLCCTGTIFISSCSTTVSDYEESASPLDISTYFNGPVTAWGMVQDYNNKVTRRFCVDLVGTWKNNNGELKETFYFDDGEISYRNWQLTRTNNNEYSGTAEDVVGTAKGQQKGIAFQWEYVLSAIVDDTDYEFTLDDWMYQIDQYRVFNKTKMKKFGVTVADITLFFDKQTPLRTCEKT